MTAPAETPPGLLPFAREKRVPQLYCKRVPLKTNSRKRRRATVVAEKDGKVLLVQERGTRRYGLPGGGIEGRESVIEAACREIREETGLNVVRAEHLFDHEGRVMFNRVVLAKVTGRVRLQHKELSDYVWWDGLADISMGSSAKTILSKAWPRAGGR